jgi:chromosome segregation ATPase
VAHLQDLQHQVSVKTLALQTLQREYDNLLQKLERMRTKCATLERKFEVSDTEINNLTDEKERLEKQVETLEKLLEEAQNARDEARSTSSEQASQYMKIMEMAGQLQAQAAEDRKKWEMERASMLTKLAESQATDDDTRHLLFRPMNNRVDVEIDSEEAGLPIGTDVESSTKPSFSKGSLPPNQVPGKKDVLLQREIKRLEARVKNLETALRAAEDESKIVREAALSLTGVGQRMESMVEKAMTATE